MEGKTKIGGANSHLFASLVLKAPLSSFFYYYNTAFLEYSRYMSRAVTPAANTCNARILDRYHLLIQKKATVSKQMSDFFIRSSFLLAN